MSFIVLDIETGGLNPLINPILSIGAVDYTTGDEFYAECRANLDQQVDDAALAVNGFTREQAFDQSKQSQTDAVKAFLAWAEGHPTKLLAGQQVGSFDILFVKHLCSKWPFAHRSVDLHSVAFARFGQSLSLDGILKACGLSAEPKPHNALTGARLERDAFKFLLNDASCGCKSEGWKS